MEAVGPIRVVTTAPAPAAASILLEPVLARPAIQCALVAASRTAVHVATGDPDVPVLSVVAPGGARLPGALVLAASAGVLDRLGAGDSLLVGDGVVGTDDVTVTITRWWGIPSVRMPDDPEQLLAGVAALTRGLATAGRPPSGLVATASERLAHAARPGSAAALTDTVRAMVGLGPGLTPAADDVLVGALLCWHHLAAAGWTGATRADSVRTAVLTQLDRTTAVSAALLHHAARGVGVPEALLLLGALRTPEVVADAVADLACVGHDSGASMARGIAIAAGAVLAALEPGRLAG